MKIKTKVKEFDSKKIFALVPHQCIKCKNKFFLEKGFKYPPYIHKIEAEYLCSSCASGIGDAEYIFNTYHKKPILPFMPPVGIRSGVPNKITNNSHITRKAIK